MVEGGGKKGGKTSSRGDDRGRVPDSSMVVSGTRCFRGFWRGDIIVALRARNPCRWRSEIHYEGNPLGCRTHRRSIDFPKERFPPKGRGFLAKQLRTFRSLCEREIPVADAPKSIMMEILLAAAPIDEARISCAATEPWSLFEREILVADAQTSIVLEVNFRDLSPILLIRLLSRI